MELTFQNKREDLQAFYDYMVKETKQGKVMSTQVYKNRQIGTFIITTLFGAISWGATGQWIVGLL
jgi:hypothetical protein